MTKDFLKEQLTKLPREELEFVLFNGLEKQFQWEMVDTGRWEREKGFYADNKYIWMEGKLKAWIWREAK